MTERVTLQPGDYVSTAGMTEDQYHAVARAFMAAGAGADHSMPMRRKHNEYMMWSKVTGNVDAGPSLRPFPNGRHLTPAQVIGAVNAKRSPIRGHDVTLTITRDDGTDCPLFKLLSGYSRYALAGGEKGAYTGLKSVTPHAPAEMLTGALKYACDELATARQHEAKAAEHRANHDGAMEHVRDMLPDGWQLVWDGEPEADMDDPANWREGDVLECVKEWYSGTEGSLYTVMPFDRPGGSALDEGVMAIQVDDDYGDESTVAHHYFRFHSRPTT